MSFCPITQEEEQILKGNPIGYREASTVYYVIQYGEGCWYNLGDGKNEATAGWGTSITSATKFFSKEAAQEVLAQHRVKRPQEAAVEFVRLIRNTQQMEIFTL